MSGGAIEEQSVWHEQWGQHPTTTPRCPMQDSYRWPLSLTHVLFLFVSPLFTRF
jgi:hypothetical protein